MKTREHGLSEKEMELVKLIMAECESTGDIQAKLKRARLFERFYTGDASRHNSGTGVGLAVVKLLTDKLGGNVSAEIKSNVLTVTLEIQ